MKYLLSKFLYAALISMLVIESVSPTSRVQAAPPAELVYFSMKIMNPKTTLRCGETVTYLVKVELAQSNGAPTPVPGSSGLPKGVSVIGVKVEAVSVDKKVGDFIATEKGYATAKTSMVFDDDLTGLGAKFKFKANKPGKTTLYFEGLVGKEYVSDKVDVKVLPCRFKVKTIGQWDEGSDGGYYSSSAVSGEAVVTADADGHYSGSASVNWVAYGFAPVMCGGYPLQIASGQTSYTGTVDENGQLIMNQTYQPVEASYSFDCGSASGWGHGLTTPEPLNISMSASGGGTTLPNILNAEWWVPMSGSVTVIVIPEENETVAFIPGEHETSWHDLSSLFDTLLALH